jgi:hypothetical protein
MYSIRLCIKVTDIRHKEECYAAQAPYNFLIGPLRFPFRSDLILNKQGGGYKK